MPTFQYTNIAFISYKREDEKWAKWLQKNLEHYKLPTEYWIFKHYDNYNDIFQYTCGMHV